MRIKNSLPLLTLGFSGFLAIWTTISGLEQLEEADALVERLELARLSLLRTQSQGVFPIGLRTRARKAQKDYLHHVVECMPVLQDEVCRIDEMARDPLFSHIQSVVSLRKKLASSTKSPRFTARPAATGTAFKDQPFLLAEPLEVNPEDVSRLLILIEGEGEKEQASAAARPLLFLSDFKIERKAAGRWLLDMALVERDWIHRHKNADSSTR